MKLIFLQPWGVGGLSDCQLTGYDMRFSFTGSEMYVAVKIGSDVNLDPIQQDNKTLLKHIDVNES